jgi:DNA-binding NarL/FixJ family response regulator
VNNIPHTQPIGRVDSWQTQQLVTPGVQTPSCIIHSSHALVFRFIKHAVCSDSSLCLSVKSYSNGLKALNGEKPQILLLDTCSIENWPRFLNKWRLEGGAAVALISSEIDDNKLELQMLYLGAAGVVRFAENLADYLPKAIHAVAQGQLWFRRGILNDYVQRTSRVLRNSSVSDCRLTTREKQIIELVQLNLSNRVIAQRLAISERTAKFHLSNILRKLNLASRKELQTLHSSEISLYPDWLDSDVGNVRAECVRHTDSGAKLLNIDGTAPG